MLRAVRLAAKLDFTHRAGDRRTDRRGWRRCCREAAPARLFEESLKMFLSGHAVASFERPRSATACCRRCCPETAAALASNRSGALRTHAAAKACAAPTRASPTTSRCRRRSCSPLLLWPAYCRDADGSCRRRACMRPKRSAAPPTASPCTSSTRIALPRRFSLPMQEIWLLQSRFSQRQRKRVFRLLAHPRFRAAFDFLRAAPVRLARARRRRRVLARGAGAAGRTMVAAQLEAQRRSKRADGASRAAPASPSPASRPAAAAPPE